MQNLRKFSKPPRRGSPPPRSQTREEHHRPTPATIFVCLVKPLRIHIMPTAFTGGALSFKGDKKKKKKAKKKEDSSKAKHKLKNDDTTATEAAVPAAAATVVEDMTPAEKRALERKRERIRIDNEKLATKSHRERIEEFNEKLGSTTEHNDIPRVRRTLLLRKACAKIERTISFFVSPSAGKCCRKRLESRGPLASKRVLAFACCCL